jgi:hypothetical protein
MANRKGVVMETGKGWAIILMENGEYQKIKTNDFLEVGEQYQEKFRLPLSYIAAAVILLALSLTTLDYYSVKAYAQVSSLAELGVNRWGRVVSVQANDETGQQILNTVELHNDTLEVAVEKLYAHTLKDEQNNKLLLHKSEISVTGVDRKEAKLEKKMLKQIDQGIKQAEKARKKVVVEDQNDVDFDEDKLDNRKKGKDIDKIGNYDLDMNKLNFKEFNKKGQEQLKEKPEKKLNFINEDNDKVLLPPESKGNNKFKNKQGQRDRSLVPGT